MGINGSTYVEGTSARVLEQVPARRAGAEVRDLRVVPTVRSAPGPAQARAGAAWQEDGRARLHSSAEGGRGAKGPAREATLVTADELLLGAIRLMTALVAALALIAAGLFVGGVLSPGQEVARYVQPGDSLYSIASAIGGAPLGQVVDDIRDLNALGSDTLSVGQRLILPEY